MGRARRDHRRQKKGPQASPQADVDVSLGSGRDQPAPASEEPGAADRVEPRAKRAFRSRLADAARSVQVEDIALFLWIVVVERLLESYFGTELRTVATLGAAPRWVYAVVFGGLAVVFYTRGPADVDVNEATSRRCVLGLFGWFVARSYFAGDGSWFLEAFAVAFLVTILIAPLNALERLPRTGIGLRRTLVLPSLLVGNSVFSGMITPEFLRGSELAGIAPEHRYIASLVLSAFLFLYVVVAPRVMAGGEWRPFSWVVRLAVYLSALQLGRPSWLDFGG
jgi:hypothetical protein